MFLQSRPERDAEMIREAVKRGVLALKEAGLFEKAIVALRGA